MDDYGKLSAFPQLCRRERSCHGSRSETFGNTRVSGVQSNSRAEAGRKRAESKRVYPIRDDIPVMLIDEATIEE
jgi:hypothetical protein